MTKVQVQITYCCCCGLTVATILIAIYTILFYGLLTGLGGWGLSQTPPIGKDTHNHYERCLHQAKEKDKLKKGVAYEVVNGQVIVKEGQNKFVRKTTSGTIIIVDASSYHCSLALYTEELKFSAGVRFPLLIMNIALYLVLIIAGILLIVAILMKFRWLLLPWIALMCIDVFRGLISVLFIFIKCHGDLSRIAVGIFFLGIQFFHISLILIIVAKFQRMHEQAKGMDVNNMQQIPPEGVILADGTHAYPTLPSNYAYSTTPARDHRDGYYQPSAYNSYAGANADNDPRLYRPPPGGQPPLAVTASPHQYRQTPDAYYAR